MGQTLLEKMTKKQICIFALGLFAAMTTFFVLGGTKGADPGVANIHIANLFIVNRSSSKYRYSFENDSNWVWYRTDKAEGENNKNYGYTSSKIVDHFRDTNTTDAKTAESLILSTKFPHPGKELTMHKVYHFMVVVMTVTMDYIRMEDVHKTQIVPTHECIMAFNAKLGYSDKDEIKDESDWKVLTYAYNQTRPLQCRFTHIDTHNDQFDGYYTCDDQHLFELGSVAHKHYILNMQFPGVETNRYCLASNVSYFGGIHLTEIHQNGGYTISLFVSKTVMFPFIMGALMFFISRIKREKRPMVLLERSILWLGIALTVLLLPIDWFTLLIDMPFMLFFSDLRQGFFYAALLIFWSIFAGEHILDQQERNDIYKYKYEIGFITSGCLSLFIFDSVDRGFQISNPFHTIWKKDIGETIARIFLGVAAAASILFAIFFIRLIYTVYRNMKLKEVALPAMQETRRSFYKNQIYRIRVLLWVTLATVVATVTCFVLDQLNETSWKFEEHSLNDWVIVSSALHFGMFGMWGTYVFGVLILYSPVGDAPTCADVRYRVTENLMQSGDASIDDSSMADEDEISFRHPKT